MSAMIPEPNTVPPAAPAEGQLTEEDLIEMREQSSGQGNNAGGSETADESIISLADSSSNFDEHAGDDFDEVGTADEPDDNYAEQIYNGWAFGRARTPNPNLPKDTVQVLTWPINKSVPVCPEWCNQADWKDAVTAAKVYLIGTAHFSKESQEDVIETIRAVQPDIVMVELCPSRISILSMDESTLLKEAKELSMEKMRNIIKQSGIVQGILHVMLLSMSAHITRQLSMAPGGEFRAAHRAVMQTQLCRLVLGDRPIHITLQRALAALTVWQKVKFFFHVCCSHFNTITPEDVERCKRQDLLEELLAEMAGDFPKLSEIFVRERDQYMVFSLQHTLASNTAQKYRSWRQFREEEEGGQVEWQPLRIVAVVGIGHTPGIVANWQSEINIGELIRVPPASRAGQILKYTVRAAIYGAAGYLLYKGAGRVARNFVKL